MPSSVVRRSVRLASLVISASVVAACRSATAPSEARLEILELSAPSSAVVGEPLTLGVRYGIGACERVAAVRAVARSTDPRWVEVELQREAVAPPAGNACPSILYTRDTTVAVVPTVAGELQVHGLQPRGRHPLVRQVQVARP